MDYINPIKKRREKITLYVGYFLMTILVILTTIILFYITEGFGYSKNGNVIQNGLLFFSSQPNPANIYINNKLQSSQTNTSMLLPAGNYSVKIIKSGYLPWQRNIIVNGGLVERFDYPFLFPAHLITNKIANYVSPPGFATESLDRHWLVVQDPSQFNEFYIYDLNNPLNPPTLITIPTSILSTATSSQSWQLVQWSSDNQHLVLKHIYDGSEEFILVDITNGSKSVNLTKTFNNISFNSLSLLNNQYDQYDLYNSQSQVLDSVNLSAPLVINFSLSQVLAYKTYGSNNNILYVTSLNAPSGRVVVNERVGSNTYIIKTLAPSPQYLLDLTTYNSTPYVVIGASNDSKVFIYQDPIGQINNNPSYVPAPIQVLLVPNPNYISFSDNAQFIMVENANHFAVYNIESGYAYNYIVPYQLQSPQATASWMDGDRLTYVTNNNLIVFDYDMANLHVLMPADPTYLPFFDVSYQYIYTISTKNNVTSLTQTSMLAP